MARAGSAEKVTSKNVTSNEKSSEMWGWICRGWIWRFWGVPIFCPEVPKTFKIPSAHKNDYRMGTMVSAFF